MNLDKSTFPTRTLAGSSFEHLVEELNKVVSPLEEALYAIVDAMPHGRDYIGRDEEYKAACAQHTENYNDLLKLKNFFEDKRQHCFEQIAK